MDGLKYRHVLSHSLGAWKSEIRVLVRLAASERCEGESGPCSFPAFCGLPASLAILGLQKHRPHLCLPLPPGFSLCLSTLSSLLAPLCLSRFPLVVKA